MPLKISRVERPTDSETLRYLDEYAIQNPMAVHSLLNEPEQIDFFICKDSGDGRIVGHISRSQTPGVVFVSIAGETEPVVRALTPFAPKSGAVIIAPAAISEVVQEEVMGTSVFEMRLMALKRGKERLVEENPAIRLSSSYAPSYVSLFGSNHPLPLVEQRLQKDAVYGVVVDGLLVSVASAVAKLPRVAFIIGVFTMPGYRGRGYGALATSAAVGDALKESEAVSLGVRRDNLPAVRIYDRLGFQTIGEQVWIDLGTGLAP